MTARITMPVPDDLPARAPSLSRMAAGALLALAGLCSGCQESGPIGPTEVRERVTRAQPASSRMVDRFPTGRRRPQNPTLSGGGANGASAASGTRARPEFELPEGWTQVASAKYRDINVRVPGGAEAWVTLMPAGAGGVAMNVNRWRRQLGLGEATGADLDALPQGEMLGQATLRFDETATDGSKRLVGHMLFAIDRSVFVRLSGSPDVVEDSIGAFESFVASLRDPAPAAAPAAPGGASAGPAGPSGPPGPSGPIRWNVPAGWVEGTPSDYQDAVWQVAPQVQCAVSIYTGDGGGLGPNLTRWAGQARRRSVPSIASLPRIEVLGVQAYVVDFSDGAGEGLVAVYAPLGSRSVFIKLTGPSAKLRERRGEFEGFCQALRAD